MTPFLIFTGIAAIAITTLLGVVSWPALSKMRKAAKAPTIPALSTLMGITLVYASKNGEGDMFLLHSTALPEKLSHVVFSYRRSDLILHGLNGTERSVGLKIWPAASEAMRKSKRLILMEVKDEIISRAFWTPLLHQHAFLTTMDEDVEEMEFGEVEMDVKVAGDIYAGR